MSDLLKKIAKTNEWWKGQGSDCNQRIEDLSKKVASLNSSINDIKGQKIGVNPLRLLSKGWAYATKIPDLNQQVEDLEEERDDLVESIIENSSKDGDNILHEIARKNEKAGAWLKAINEKKSKLSDKKNTVTEIQTRTQEVIDTVHRAWKEADEADDMEGADMIFSNPLVSVASHFETEEAIEYLGYVKTSLGEYKTFMDNSGVKLSSLQLTGQRADALSGAADWDLVAGAFDFDIVSFFTSWENMKKLGEAKEKLEGLEKQLQSNLEVVNKSVSLAQDEYNQVNDKYMEGRSNMLKRCELPDAFYKFLPEKTHDESHVLALQMNVKCG